MPAYACFSPRMQVVAHVRGPRAFLVILFPKVDFCAFRSDIFHFNTPPVNSIFDWALKWPWAFRVWASLGTRGPSHKGYEMRCLHLGMAMSVLHFLYLTGPCPWNVGNVCFNFLLYVIALCMMYVCVCIYICLRVCGWLSTSYNGLLWLNEWPSLITSALDLVVWVCTQGDWCRCIFM